MVNGKYVYRHTMAGPAADVIVPRTYLCRPKPILYGQGTDSVGTKWPPEPSHSSCSSDHCDNPKTKCKVKARYGTSVPQASTCENTQVTEAKHKHHTQLQAKGLEVLYFSPILYELNTGDCGKIMPSPLSYHSGVFSQCKFTLSLQSNTIPTSF